MTARQAEAAEGSEAELEKLFTAYFAKVLNTAVAEFYIERNRPELSGSEDRIAQFGARDTVALEVAPTKASWRSPVGAR